MDDKQAWKNERQEMNREIGYATRVGISQVFIWFIVAVVVIGACTWIYLATKPAIVNQETKITRNTNEFIQTKMSIIQKFVGDGQLDLDYVQTYSGKDGYTDQVNFHLIQLRRNVRQVKAELTYIENNSNCTAVVNEAESFLQSAEKYMAD